MPLDVLQVKLKHSQMSLQDKVYDSLLLRPFYHIKSLMGPVILQVICTLYLLHTKFVENNFCLLLFLCGVIEAYRAGNKTTR